MPRKQQSRLDYRALAEFRFEVRRFLNFSEQAAHLVGLEPQQHQALLAIKGLPADRKATLSALAERLLIRHHSAVELANRLEAHGLLRRSRGREDRREVLLRLTPRGERLLKELSSAHRRELKSAGRRLLGSLRTAVAHAGYVKDSQGGGTKNGPRDRRTPLARVRSAA